MFDYIRRAMPPDKPGSLKDDEVYGLVAYLLVAERADSAGRGPSTPTTLPKIKMPARDHFCPRHAWTAQTEQPRR